MSSSDLPSGRVSAPLDASVTPGLTVSPQVVSEGLRVCLARTLQQTHQPASMGLVHGRVSANVRELADHPHNYL